MTDIVRCGEGHLTRWAVPGDKQHPCGCVIEEMTMTDKIKPALTAEEWAGVARREHVPGRIIDGIWPDGTVSVNSECGVELDEIPGAIAILNAALSDSDQRKITREKLRLLRDQVAKDDTIYDINRECNAFLDALASYLPPEQ